MAGGWVRDKILASREFCRRSSNVNSGSVVGMGGNLLEDGGEGLNSEVEEGEMKRITSKFKGEKGRRLQCCIVELILIGVVDLIHGVYGFNYEGCIANKLQVSY